VGRVGCCVGQETRRSLPESLALVRFVRQPGACLFAERKSATALPAKSASQTVWKTLPQASKVFFSSSSWSAALVHRYLPFASRSSQSNTNLLSLSIQDI
jgi:hypothetical protein